MTVTDAQSDIVLNRHGERVISADSHVAIDQSQIKAKLDPALPRRVRPGPAGLRRPHGRQHGPGQDQHRRHDPQPPRRLHPARLPRRPRAPGRHDRRRGRRRGHLLRGQRLPVHRRHGARLHRGHPRLQRRAGRLRLRRPPPPRRQLPDPDPRRARRGGRGAAGAGDGRQVAPDPRVPDRDRRPRLLRRVLRPAVDRGRGVRPAAVLPHRRQHLASTTSPAATPPPRRA